VAHSGAVVRAKGLPRLVISEKQIPGPVGINPAPSMRSHPSVPSLLEATLIVFPIAQRERTFAAQVSNKPMRSSMAEAESDAPAGFMTTACPRKAQ
jgi:hypothetical protein